MALFTACYFGMMLLYHVLLALGAHLFFQSQILCHRAYKLLVQISCTSIAIPHLQASTRQGVRPLPIDQVDNLQACLTVG